MVAGILALRHHVLIVAMYSGDPAVHLALHVQFDCCTLKCETYKVHNVQSSDILQQALEETEDALDQWMNGRVFLDFIMKGLKDAQRP